MRYIHNIEFILLNLVDDEVKREKDQKTFEELKRLEEKVLKYFGEDLLISMLNDLQNIYEF